MIDSKIFLFIRKYRNRADIQILHSQQKKNSFEILRFPWKAEKKRKERKARSPPSKHTLHPFLTSALSVREKE